VAELLVQGRPGDELRPAARHPVQPQGQPAVVSNATAESRSAEMARSFNGTAKRVRLSK
jgi:hypothetical protein